MALKKTIDNSKTKAYMLLLFLVIFLVWRFAGASTDSIFSNFKPTASAPTPTPSAPIPTASASTSTISATPVAVETSNFIDDLLLTTKPRLTWFLESKTDGNFQGSIDFLQGDKVVERFKITELHALGAALLRTEYGFNLLYKGKSYLIAWAIQKPSVASPVVAPVGDKSDKNHESDKADKTHRVDNSGVTFGARGYDCKPKSLMTAEEWERCNG